MNLKKTTRWPFPHATHWALKNRWCDLFVRIQIAFCGTNWILRNSYGDTEISVKSLLIIWLTPSYFSRFWFFEDCLSIAVVLYVRIIQLPQEECFFYIPQQKEGKELNNSQRPELIQVLQQILLYLKLKIDFLERYRMYHQTTQFVVLLQGWT